MEIGVKNKIFTKTSTSDAHLYSNQDLRKLLVPIIVEQLLSSLMGTADTMMVSNVGSAAISAVSLVDAINILVIQALSALAAGGAHQLHLEYGRLSDGFLPGQDGHQQLAPVAGSRFRCLRPQVVVGGVFLRLAVGHREWV